MTKERSPKLTSVRGLVGGVAMFLAEALVVVALVAITFVVATIVLALL